MTGVGRGPVQPPAPRPCESCPYRRDVASGVWAASEYARLPDYDRPTGDQPPGVFLCHQLPTDDPRARARVCGGWAGVHANPARGFELLALRFAPLFGTLTPRDVQAVADYVSPVPLWESGAQAAAHGINQIDYPGVAAQRAIAKVMRHRPDITDDQPE